MVEDKEQRIETLQDRVDELEATVSKMLPSRRDALKLGAAGAVGAVGMAGSASAQNSNQVGTIGTDSDRVDVNAEDIDAVSVNTDEAAIKKEGPIVKTWAQDGADADERLDNALSAASDGYLIKCEPADYTANRTVQKSVELRFPECGGVAFHSIGADWTLNTFGITLRNANIEIDNTITLDSTGAIIGGYNSGSGSNIQVNADECRVLNLRRGNVTFDSATSGGLVDGCVNVTVNGNTTDNSVGDVA